MLRTSRSSIGIRGGRPFLHLLLSPRVPLLSSLVPSTPLAFLIWSSASPPSPCTGGLVAQSLAAWGRKWLRRATDTWCPERHGRVPRIGEQWRPEVPKRSKMRSWRPAGRFWAPGAANMARSASDRSWGPWPRHGTLQSDKLI